MSITYSYQMSKKLMPHLNVLKLCKKMSIQTRPGYGFAQCASIVLLESKSWLLSHGCNLLLKMCQYNACKFYVNIGSRLQCLPMLRLVKQFRCCTLRYRVLCFIQVQVDVQQIRVSLINGSNNNRLL